MKAILIFFILTVCFSIGCNSHSTTYLLAGKWKIIRVVKSLSKKEPFEVFRQSTWEGAILEFGKNNVLNIIQGNDSSSHYYTITDDNKFLMFEMFGNVAGFYKIIELKKEAFKMALNFDDTLVLEKIK
jgi:hypothetical protein